jgi:hypothetical protein
VEGQGTGQGRGDTVFDDERFTPDEWATLRFSPFWILAAFAGCFRGFDPLEFEAFSGAVEEAAERAGGSVGGVVLGRVALDLDRLAIAFGADHRSVATGLWEVSRLLKRLPDDETELFREALVSGVGEGLARARGRFGRLISEEDARIVELVAVLLS